MKRPPSGRRSIAAACPLLIPAAVMLLTGWVSPSAASAGEKVLVVGDSLTKEYQSEFVALYPDRPSAWQARNWIELLNDRRNDSFDLGSWSVYTDWRLTGHEYNWAKPGGTAREFRNFLRQTPDAREEVVAGSGGEALWALYPAWRTTFTNSLGGADRVVIFFGGNDLALGNSDPVANPTFDGGEEGPRKQIDYASIYEGTHGEASNPSRLQTSIRSNAKSIIEWFRNPRTWSDGTPREPRFTGPMIICAVPHVGCTPKIQAETGTDPVRTAVLTQMIETLNVEIRDFAATKDVGFADVYAVTKQILDPGDFRMGGVRFSKTADPDCGPRALFSGDGFHPNTPAQAAIAQAVTDAFLEKYPDMAPDLPRLGDREIITEILGLAADTDYQEWLAEADVPEARRGPLQDPDGDGLANLMEYALADRSPDTAEPGGPFRIVREPHPEGWGEQMTVSWRPRYGGGNIWCEIIPEVSIAMDGWTPVPAEEITRSADGTLSVSMLVTSQERIFFRLRAAVTAGR